MKLAVAIALAALPPSVHPWPIGVGPRYHPPAPVRDGKPVDGLRCGHAPVKALAHIELFANRRVVVVPAGIGRGPACAYPVATTAPTGVVRLRSAVTVGDLFHVWGRTLEPQRLLSFRGRVEAYVGGHRFAGDPRTIRLTRHAQIVLEVGGRVAPHPSYLFPKGPP